MRAEGNQFFFASRGFPLLLQAHICRYPYTKNVLDERKLRIAQNNIPLSLSRLDEASHMLNPTGLSYQVGAEGVLCPSEFELDKIAPSTEMMILPEWYIRL